MENGENFGVLNRSDSSGDSDRSGIFSEDQWSNISIPT